MDSLTQAILGASVGQAMLGKKAGNRAILWGAIGGLIPDMDMLSRFFVDGLTANELHRGFSHSLVFCIVAAIATGGLISKMYNVKYGTAREWMLMMFGSLFTHTWLDAYTTWGTQLFWPIENKIAFNNIFIIDPLYTLPFLVLLLMVLTKKRENPKRTKYNNLALLISSSYMLATIIFKSIAYVQTKDSVIKQGIAYTEIETRPTPFNSILWNATIETDSSFYIGYYSLLDKNNTIDFVRFDKNHALLGEMSNEKTLKRLVKLSEGKYTIRKKGNKIIFNDLRFGQRGLVSSDKDFVFSYELFYDENNFLRAIETPKTFKGSSPVLKELLDRISGI